MIVNFDECKVSVPVGRSGDWEVSRFSVSEYDAKLSHIRASLHGRGYVPEGEYTQLTQAGSLWMSDTPDEISDQLRAIQLARGLCRVHGLGLGITAAAMLRKPTVDKVEVVELSEDVISLVGPSLVEQFGSRIEIIQGDALALKAPKGRKYDLVWHDIWQTIARANLPEMHRLHRKWARASWWQGSWGREACEDARW